MAVSGLLLAYLAGGITLPPLIFLTVVLLGYFQWSKEREDQHIHPAAQETSDPKSGLHDKDLQEKSETSFGGTEVAAAYFAVCREYVPGGINGKPPERSTPAGEVLITESPSVYQSMYRSIFERGKSQIPTIEGEKRDGKAVKKARNVFFVVLRHEHLMLYDDAEQLEVRHVISLMHHDVDVFAGGEELSEGDLWIKRNCIRLARNSTTSDGATLSKPFYLFSDNCSEKEDFYHSLLHAQAQGLEAHAPPEPAIFETPHMIKLVQQLHLADADPHTRWLNALIGRVFLALYKTDRLEAIVRAKINRKISRVPKPNFITSIQIQDVDMGDSAPVISNPRLKELTVDGETVIEADIKYNGGFRLQIAAIARIDLGTRFKAREVDLVLAGVLRRLNGHILIRLKPPPSNRLWIAFEHMPQLDLNIEPIVSSRQITYGLILRAIESRIREVISETLVLPNWDDSPFFDTSGQSYRGGIWESELSMRHAEDSTADGIDENMSVSADLVLSDAEAGTDSLDMASRYKQKTMSMPTLLDPSANDQLHRRAARASFSSILESEDASASTAVSLTPSGVSTPVPVSPSASRPHTPAEKPKAMRSNSFASAASPLVSANDATVLAPKPRTNKGRGHRDAVDLVKEVKSRSDSTSATDSATGRNTSPYSSFQKVSVELGAQPPEEDRQQEHGTGFERRQSEPLASSVDVEAPGPKARPLSSATFPLHQTATAADALPHERSHNQSPTTRTNIGTATATAKKWGWNVLNRQPDLSTGSGSGSGSVKASAHLSAHLGSVPSTPRDLSTHHQPTVEETKSSSQVKLEPMGRGQPLPPPGTPLPGPAKSLWASSNLSLGSLKRKPVAAPQLPPRKSDWSIAQDTRHSSKESTDPPALPSRKTAHGQPHGDGASGRQSRLPGITPDTTEECLVVAAPAEDERFPPALVPEVPIDTWTDAGRHRGSSADSANAPKLGDTGEVQEDEAMHMSPRLTTSRHLIIAEDEAESMPAVTDELEVLEHIT